MAAGGCFRKLFLGTFSLHRMLMHNHAQPRTTTHNLDSLLQWIVVSLSLSLSLALPPPPPKLDQVDFVEG